MEQDEQFQSPLQFFLASPDLLRAERKEEYMSYGIRLYQATLKGDWEAAERILNEYKEEYIRRINAGILNVINDEYDDLINAAITKQGDTVLHIAAAAMHTKFVQELVKRMKPEDLEIRNKKGNTALSVAAMSGDKPIAEAMVERNRKLPRIRGHLKLTPLQMAAMLGHKDMVEYLFKFHESTGLTNSDLMDVFAHTINSDLYDTALEILHKYPNLAIARDQHQQTALHILARKSRTSNRAQLTLWRRFSNFFTFVHAVDLDDKKSLPPTATELVERLCRLMLKVKSDDDISSLITTPTNLVFEAAESGNVDFLRILLRSYPDLIWQCDNNRRTIFHVAVENRQEKVFRLIHELGAIKGLLTISVDDKNNNILHLAARQPPSERLNHISGAAFQMQWERQWFKVVEELVRPEYAESKNAENKTPRALFTEEHNELRKKGEKWMRITAASYSLVATLIVTMVFSAGAKILIDTGSAHYREYFAFAAFDAVSLVYSTAAILVFLSIMTSRYAEDDFLESLPNKLLIGLILLVLAIATMMMAFFTIFYINFQSHFYFLSIVVLGLPGLLMIVIFLLRDSFFLVYRLVAKRNVLRKPLHPGLLDEVNLSVLPLASNVTNNQV